MPAAELASKLGLGLNSDLTVEVWRITTDHQEVPQSHIFFIHSLCGHLVVSCNWSVCLLMDICFGLFPFGASFKTASNTIYKSLYYLYMYVFL